MLAKTPKKASTNSRRNFFKKSGGIALLIGTGGLLPQLISCEDPSQIKEALKAETITAWIQLSKDGNITIYSPATEMGQGSMTAFPIIIAEEMDADWEKYRWNLRPRISNSMEEN
ncbi:MAG: molybdopterin cofactor-binding domain-containing protein [Bacteroidota bacterium]